MGKNQQQLETERKAKILLDHTHARDFARFFYDVGRDIHDPRSIYGAKLKAIGAVKKESGKWTVHPEWQSAVGLFIENYKQKLKDAGF